MLVGFILGILSSLITEGLVFVCYKYYKEYPKFELKANFIPGKYVGQGYSLPVLDLLLFNKKKWLSFEKEEVIIALFFPVRFMENKERIIRSPQEELRWVHDVVGANKVVIDGVEYFLGRMAILMPIGKYSTSHFLRIVGDFNNDEMVRIYYFVITKDGTCPGRLKEGMRMDAARSGKLPYVNIDFKASINNL